MRRLSVRASPSGVASQRNRPGDSSLQIMREWLGRLGYRAHESGIRLNVDCSNRCLMGLERKLETVSRGEPVAIIGHSRGGHFAKALAIPSEVG